MAESKKEEEKIKLKTKTINAIDDVLLNCNLNATPDIEDKEIFDIILKVWGLWEPLQLEYIMYDPLILAKNGADDKVALGKTLKRNIFILKEFTKLKQMLDDKTLAYVSEKRGQWNITSYNVSSYTFSDIQLDSFRALIKVLISYNIKINDDKDTELDVVGVAYRCGRHYTCLVSSYKPKSNELSILHTNRLEPIETDECPELYDIVLNCLSEDRDKERIYLERHMLFLIEAKGANAAALVLQGAEGTGKNTVPDTLNAIVLGTPLRSYKSPGLEVLDTNDQVSFYRNPFPHAEEVKASITNMDVLKRIVDPSADDIPVRGLYVGRVLVANTFAWTVSGNFYDDNSRQQCILNLKSNSGSGDNRRFSIFTILGKNIIDRCADLELDAADLYQAAKQDTVILQQFYGYLRNKHTDIRIVLLEDDPDLYHKQLAHLRPQAFHGDDYIDALEHKKDEEATDLFQHVFIDCEPWAVKKSDLWKLYEVETKGQKYRLDKQGLKVAAEVFIAKNKLNYKWFSEQKKTNKANWRSSFHYLGENPRSRVWLKEKGYAFSRNELFLNSPAKLSVVTSDDVMSGDVMSGGVTSDDVMSDSVTSDNVVRDSVTSDGVTSDGVVRDSVTSDGVTSDGVVASTLGERANIWELARRKNDE